MEAQSVAARLNSSGLLRTQALIGGKWRDAYDGKTIKVSFISLAPLSLSFFVQVRIYYEETRNLNVKRRASPLI